MATRRIFDNDGSDDEETELYTPQVEAAVEKYQTALRRKRTSAPRGNPVQADEDDDLDEGVSETKRLGWRFVRWGMWVCVFFLCVTAVAVGTGVSAVISTSRQKVLHDRTEARTRLNLPDCQHFANLLSEADKMRYAEDIPHWKKAPCLAAGATGDELAAVQVVREIAYAYSLCEEGKCGSVFWMGLGVVFSGLSSVMYCMNYFMAFAKFILPGMGPFGR